MKNKIIIIGKNSFVGKNLYIYFKGKTVVPVPKQVKIVVA